MSSLQRTIARTRSRIDWLGDGDANTSFFHSHVRYRKRKNLITKIQVGNDVITSHEAMEEEFWNHFNGLLGAQPQRSQSFNLDFFHRPGMDLSALDAPISEDEVWKVILSVPLDKAPGLDGFTGRFYRECWSIIKQDVMAAIGALHGGDSRKLHLLNSAFIVLIPKQEDAAQVGDFRPISLVHSFAKLVTKILASRLAPHMPNLVASSQSAFIHGRCIHETTCWFIKRQSDFIVGRNQACLLN